MLDNTNRNAITFQHQQQQSFALESQSSVFLVLSQPLKVQQ